MNAGHVDAIYDTINQVPVEVPAEERERYERILLELATEVAPHLVRRAGRHLIARLDPDGKQPDDDDPGLAEPERELLYSWTRKNQLKLRGTVDAETGQLLETLLSALAKPRPKVDSAPDTRSAGQRQGDAFAELLEYTQRAAERPTEAGEKPVVMVSTTLDDLLKRDPLMSGERAAQLMFTDGPTLNWQSPITAEQARRLACDARMVPVVLGADGEVLDLGREVRTATRAQRRALANRDGGCVMCGRTPRCCEVHHLIPWEDYGPSNLDNMLLLCSACHRLVHHSEWQIRMAADGRPECIPPSWLDPRRKPRRYTAPHIDPLE